MEKVGNALPNPAALFGLFAQFILLLSALVYWLNWQGINLSTGEKIIVNNLLIHEGLHRILLEMVTNYTSFASLGIVMVALLGIGICREQRIS